MAVMYMNGYVVFVVLVNKNKIHPLLFFSCLFLKVIIYAFWPERDEPIILYYCMCVG